MKILRFNERYIEPPKEEAPILKTGSLVKIINDDLIDQCHFWVEPSNKDHKLFTLVGRSTPFILESVISTNLKGEPRSKPYLLSFYYNPKVFFGWVSKDDVKQITETEIEAEKI